MSTDYTIPKDEIRAGRFELDGVAWVPERTCEIIEYPDAPIPVCSECGAVQPEDYAVYYCWNCGARVSNDDSAPENGVRTDGGAVITGKRRHMIGGSE